MSSPGVIDRGGLLNWADSIGARNELPRLIRRLILETGRGVVELGFPAGEGVSAGSWDGSVRASEDAPFVPSGLWLWELSVEKSPGAKANADYAKRTSTPDGSPTADCTYVAVAVRPWTKRQDWAKDRMAKGRWKAVRTLGVDDLETWLESAPITHAWLSESVGLRPYGLTTAQTWWDRWSGATTPSFPSSAVVAGRDDAVAALRSALSTPGEVVTIRASSLDEGAAFVAAFALAEEAADGGALLARTAFVDDVEAWRRLRDHPTPLVLVALNEAVAAEFTPGSAHVLVVPLTGTANADVKLPPIDSLAAAQVLKDAGLAERQADAAGKLARLSLLAARRRLANKRELHEPEWGRSPASRTVRRSLLLGRWHEGAEGDREIVEEVMGMSFDLLSEEIAGLGAGGDPLVARVGGAVGVISPIDAFLVLRGELRADDLERFEAAVRTVLTERDPRLELPQADRWRASLLGKHRRYSDDLRQGLARTLALLGAHGDEQIAGTATTGRDWAALLVRDLLAEANADPTCQLWASLADVLALLAEAAPSEFLEAVREGTNGSAPVLRAIFGDTPGGDVFSTDSAHSSLLWALETVAWSSDHFGQVVDLLARLAEIDPGGRLANRPFASLVAILLPWFPQNSVSVERRLSAIDGLRANHAEIAWQLLLALLPELHGASGHISEPEFRDWKPEEISVPIPEYRGYVDELYERVLEDVGREPERWAAVIDKIDNVSPTARAATLERLREVSGGDSLPSALRNTIWEALRQVVARHREFAHAEWALPEDQVASIEEVGATFEPDAPIDRRGWLFREQRPDIPDVQSRDSFHAYERALAGLRAQAATEIIDSHGWEEIAAFARTLDPAWFLGEALAQAQRFEHEGDFLELLGSEDPVEANLAAGYVWKRFRDEQWSWLDSVIADSLAPRQIARLLLYTGDYPKAWEVADELGQEVAEAFWSEFRNDRLGEFEHVDFAAQRLLDVGRPAAALDLIALYLRRSGGVTAERAELIANALDALLAHPDRDTQMRVLSRHDLIELFTALDESELPRERVARLEWAYLPVFGIDARPVALAAMLSEEPEFFVDLIQRIYRPRDIDEDEAAQTEEGERKETDPEARDPDAGELTEDPDTAEGEELRQALATNAYRLLSEWKRIPGLREDRTVDAEKLEAWVTTARARLVESGHGAVGDSHIGRVLASGPADEDGSRPGVAVRDLLERLQNPDIEDGLRVELYNSRGPTTRGVFDGGDQERAVAANYREQAEKFADRWPRAASLLRELAEGYEREARRLDEEAERRRKGFET